MSREGREGRWWGSQGTTFFHSSREQQEVEASTTLPQPVSSHREVQMEEGEEVAEGEELGVTSTMARAVGGSWHIQ